MKKRYQLTVWVKSTHSGVPEQLSYQHDFTFKISAMIVRYLRVIGLDYLVKQKFCTVRTEIKAI